MSELVPRPKVSTPQTNYGVLHYVGRIVLRLSGWRLVGELPDAPKTIAVVAPHTSNFDFVYGIAMAFTLNLKLTILIKHTLFRGVLGRFLRRCGGVPVVRHAPKGLVEQVVDKINKADKIMVVVTPEGTRKETGRWKTGFLRIAKDANIPVCPVFIDFPSKTIGFKSVIEMTGDTETDLLAVQAVLKGYTGKQ